MVNIAFCNDRHRRGPVNCFEPVTDIPVAVSFPHFYGGDPSLADNVDGIRPDVNKHESLVAVQPVMNI